MSKKKIFLWVGGVVVALLLIVGIAIAGNTIHKSHEANDAKDAYSDSYNKADKGKYDSTQKLKDKADQIEKSGSKADKKALKDAREGKVSQDEKVEAKARVKMTTILYCQKHSRIKKRSMVNIMALIVHL